MDRLNLASAVVWDVLVVGAGPAGSFAARQLARQGARVLLVDRAPLGRRKICGCCLNQSALRMLESWGLGKLVRLRGAIPLQSMEVAARLGRASILLPSGVSLSREAFDSALVEEAVESGATFIPETYAALGPSNESSRCVRLTRTGQEWNAHARMVLAADGLGSKLLSRSWTQSSVARPDSRIGAGVILPSAPEWIESGRIYMACSTMGYVGMVVLEGGRLNVAAALDANGLRRSGCPSTLAGGILNEVGWDEIAGLESGKWQGTMSLTRQSVRLWDERVLVLGDAAGYVEPFTGEGIAWALASAIEIAPLVLQSVRHWSPDIGIEWQHVYRQKVMRRQRTCQILARALRHPMLVRGAIKLLHHQPALARHVVRRLNSY